MKTFVYIRPFFFNSNFYFLKFYFSSSLYCRFKNINNTIVNFNNFFIPIFFNSYFHFCTPFFFYSQRFFPFFFSNLFSRTFFFPFFFSNLFSRYFSFCSDFFDFSRDYTKVLHTDDDFFFTFIPFFIAEVTYFSCCTSSLKSSDFIIFKNYDFPIHLLFTILSLYA